MAWYLGGIWIALIASVSGLGLIIFQTTPATASVSIKSLFFLALFVGLWSLGTLAGYRLRNKSSYSTLTAAFIYGFLSAFVIMSVILVRKII